MIKLLGWCTVVAGLVAVGWFARGAVPEAVERAPVTVAVTVRSAEPQKAAAPAQSARKAAPKAATTAAPKARPAAVPTEPAETNDAVGPWTPKGIGYYDVRQAAGIKY